MAEFRSMFKSIFGREEQPKSVDGYDKFKLLNSYDSNFTVWDGVIYNNDIVRSCLRPKANAVGKLHPVHIRTDKDGKTVQNPTSSIKYLLRFPNQYMSMQKLLEKLMNQRELTNNGFAFIKRNEYGDPIAIFPVPTSNVELYEHGEELYMKFFFKTGKYMTVPYVDVIHLRKDFNQDEFFGENGTKAITNIMKVIDTTDKGVVRAIKNSATIKCLMKFKQVLRPEDKKIQVEEFAKNYLDIESAENNNIATTDSRYDVEQVKDNSYVPNDGTMTKYEKRLQKYFGVNDAIVSNDFTENQWNSFYEAEIESVALELADQFTYKLFTKHEIECGNEIIFEASSLQYSSMTTKLGLERMVDRGAMSPNEWRKIMNLGSIESGDEYIRRLDTAPVETKPSVEDPLKEGETNE